MQIRLLQAPCAAAPQAEGVLEDARMREDAGDQDGQQRDAGQPDEHRAPCPRQVERDVEVDQKFAERRVLFGQRAVAGDCPVVVLGWRIGEDAGAVLGGGGQRQIERRLCRAAGLRRLDRAIERAGGELVRHGCAGRFPPCDVPGEDGERAGEADEIDEGGEGEAEDAMPVEHGADRARRQRPAARRVRLGGLGHTGPCKAASAKPVSVVVTIMASDRIRRGSASVQIIASAQTMGIVSPPMRTRVGGAPGTQAAAQ